jgi:hypothetical protein
MYLHGPGVTPEQYERVSELMDIKNNKPEGNVIHVAFFDDRGMHVSDVWESREHFERFRQERLGPAMQEAGMAGQGPPPEPIFNEVHDYFVQT